MATYQELFSIAGDTPAPLAQRITVALAVKAQEIAIDVNSTANQKAWAVSSLKNPSGDYQAVLNYLLATNKAAPVSGITGANDSAVQTAVNNAVDQLLGA